MVCKDGVGRDGLVSELSCDFYVTVQEPSAAQRRGELEEEGVEELGDD